MDGDALLPSRDVAWLRDVVAGVAELADAASDSERIERIRQFEILKSAVAAAQLRDAVAFDASQRVEQAVAGVDTEHQGRGIAAQLGLATHRSPWHARRWLGWGKVLTTELPVTFEQLRAGRTTERRALSMAQETVWLSREDRAEVDAVVGPHLPELSDRRVENEARAHAQRLDPAGAVERRRTAVRERRVTLRPLPDTMSSLTTVNTVERGVEMWARLRRDADALVGTGQAGDRTRDQVMADLLYERATGRDAATGPDVEVELLITTDALLGAEPTDSAYGVDAGSDDGIAAGLDAEITRYLEHLDRCLDEAEHGLGVDEPAMLSADGIAPVPIPAALARQLIASAPQAWIRRLFTTPDGGDLVALESRRRQFSDGQRRFLRYRDQYCTTPWCGAPIRHADHAVPADRGGPTSIANGNGKCAACNYAKQAPGWVQVPAAGAGGRGLLRTPTGAGYRIDPPPLPGARPHRDRSPLVGYFARALETAG